MAMNKKEQAEFDAAKKAAVVARALNWTEPVLPDVAIPKGGEADTTGFLFNSYSSRVMYARSSAINHATSDDGMPPKTTRQQPRALFSTKILALKALRHEVEKECAERLAGIDMQIRQEPPP